MFTNLYVYNIATKFTWHPAKIYWIVEFVSFKSAQSINDWTKGDFTRITSGTSRQGRLQAMHVCKLAVYTAYVRKLAAELFSGREKFGPFKNEQLFNNDSFVMSRFTGG